MSKVIGLDGKHIEGAPVNPDDALEALKELIKEIETGKCPMPKKWLFIFTHACPKHPNDPSDIARGIRAPLMTTEEVNFELDLFKLHILSHGQH